METRKISNRDVDRLLELQKRYDHVFDLSRSIGTAVAEEAGKVIAFGALFPRMEAAILIDNELPRQTRSQAIHLLYDVAVQVAKVHGARELLAFSKSPVYSNFLAKRLGFEKLNELPLILEL